jgi:uncharacterized protein
MPLVFNIRHVEDQELVLRGELPAAELDLDALDELIHAPHPLVYDLTLERMEHAILAQGDLQITLECECSRCLKPFQYQLRLADWTCHLALTGDEKAEVVNDCVDLTPYIREDILLAFPQHPLCKPDCKGLAPPKDMQSSGDWNSGSTSAAWAELNKLKNLKK